MVGITRIIGLAAFCGVTAVYGSSPDAAAVSTYDGASTSLNPTQTEKAKSEEKGQSDGGRDKKEGDVEKGSDKKEGSDSGNSNQGNDCAHPECTSKYGQSPSASGQPTYKPSGQQPPATTDKPSGQPSASGQPSGTTDKPSGQPSAPGQPSGSGQPSGTTYKPSGQPSGTTDKPSGQPSGTTYKPSGQPSGTTDKPSGHPSGTTDKPSGQPSRTTDKPNGQTSRTVDKPDGKSSSCTDKPPSATDKPNGGGGGGKKITIIVAPTQGVFRYLPFAVKPSAGDTVNFMWGANNHTVTKSSALTPCNQSLDSPFASGTQSKDFIFDLVINDTQPIFIYCGTATHCQKGMFAMINPPSNVNGSTSVDKMLPLIAANNTGVRAYSEYTSSQTNGSAFAATWGGDIDIAALPEWSHQYVAENILFTRSFAGINRETIKDDGSIDLSSAHSTPFVFPKNVAAVLASSSNATTPSAAGTSLPDIHPTTSGTASPSVTRSSALSGSGGYVNSASKALILGPVVFIVSLIVV